MTRLPLYVLVAAASLLAGCDMLGIESPEKIAAVRDADGRAIGGACRHAGRAIEDCYQLNKKADRAAVFAGWREMNDYMRENQIEAVAPRMPDPADGEKGAEKSGKKADKSEKGDKADKADKGGEKSPDKAAKSGVGKTGEGKEAAHS